MGGPVNCSDSELSIYLQALEEGYLATSSSVINPSAPSKSIHIASKSFTHGNKMVAFRGFQFSMTLEHSQERSGGDSPMLYAAGSRDRARTSAPQAVEPESTEQDPASGWKWPESSVKYDRASRSWKTRQYSLHGGLDEFSETWPRWGTMRDGECSPLPMSERPTFERGSGFWPTLNTEGWRSDGELKMLASLLDEEEYRALTDRAAESKRKRWLPTLTRNEYKQGKGNYPSQKARNEPGLSHRFGGKLNPEWAEWFMGWPVGWTDLKHSGMDKFRAWLRSHGKR